MTSVNEQICVLMKEKEGCAAVVDQLLSERGNVVDNMKQNAMKSDHHEQKTRQDHCRSLFLDINVEETLRYRSDVQTLTVEDGQSEQRTHCEGTKKMKATRLRNVAGRMGGESGQEEDWAQKKNSILGGTAQPPQEHRNKPRSERPR